MSDNTTVGHAVLARLRAAGIDYFLANAGTDFPPIIEAIAQAGDDDGPTAMVIPHENVAVSMAHGYAMVAGKPLAVMLHVNVGTSNAICALTNAYRTNVPLVLMAGRTPWTEHTGLSSGTRSRHIHWAQEMFDQAGMLRELVKWDYELRSPDEVNVVIDRAITISQSDIQGPVYLSIPREVLAAPAVPSTAPRRAAPTGVAHPDPDQIAEAAEILMAAENPLIITADVGKSVAAAGHLAELVERYAIPVITHVPRYLCLGNDHPMHLDYEPSPHLAQADAVLALDCDVPWIPATDPVHPEAKVIHLAQDPLFSRYPIRGFPSALSIAADAVAALPLLAEAMAGADEQKIEARRARVADARQEVRNKWQGVRDNARQAQPIHPAWLAQCVGELLNDDTILVNEMGVAAPHANLNHPGRYFGPSPAGGLGWGMGAALGAKLAAPDDLIIAAIGDGSYFFGNPMAAHYCSRAYDLPILFIVVNNHGWGAVRRATKAMYPDGKALTGNDIPLSRIDPAPDYEQIIEACGGYGERVTDPDALPDALARAVKMVTEERRQVLLNVIVSEVV
ncbi:MAG: thiamine pyrophosphate-requiring protein [Rhodospirillaceae bacterium]|jgi:acetolactate synthase I/II/III large subunit|nr:thiamine pyrophosphate-requiring protein [Rhodospirillaceae bacterium]MBT6426218.1 thiamine pyrophosphate-requiring protein [Rhodospirillaceae bacterium]MBT7759238.1 thiamine pyrophosphate-requiring protein [Rhodospirillaceae bacterium]